MLRFRSPVTLLALACLAATPLAAQMRDALPVPRGVVRIGAGASYAQWTERFGAGGAAESLGVPFSSAFAPPLAGLQATQSELERFFGATATRTGGPAAPDPVTLGTVAVRASAERVHLPFFVEVGVTERIALRAGLSAQRDHGELVRTGFAGGNVGLNPDANTNARVLGTIDPAFANLGRARFLPDSASPLGQELIRRANLLAGGNAGLRLPGTALGASALLGADSLALAQFAAPRRWRAEGASAGVRVQLRGAGEGLTERGVRSALIVEGRLPLDRRARGVEILAPPRDVIGPEAAAELRAAKV
jgi:hypothetical protein